MSKLTKSWRDKKEPEFDSSMLKIGEMMEATDECIFGEIILGVYGGFMSLTNPSNTWTYNDIPIYKGRKLKSGESITLTQE